MSAFESLVSLSRMASQRRLAGTDLFLTVTASDVVDSLLESIEAGSWDIEMQTVSGVRITTAASQAGQALQIVVHGLTSVRDVFVENIGALLRYNSGQFKTHAPQNYYLLQENYASWEPERHSDVLAYERTRRVLHLVRKLADVVRKTEDGGEDAIFLTSRKLVIPFIYDVRALDKVASDEQVSAFESAVFDEHHVKARGEITKRVLVRFLDYVDEAERFTDLLARIPVITQAVLADYDLYASDYSFDKVREEFERRKLDFIVKLNSAGSDAMNKLIAIPVGQGLLASQMKTAQEHGLSNLALLMASLIFAVIAAMLLVNYVLTLRQIRSDLWTEKRLLEEKAAPVAKKLKPMISELDDRIGLHLWAMPAALTALLLVTTVFTVLTYLRLA